LAITKEAPPSETSPPPAIKLADAEKHIAVWMDNSESGDSYSTPVLASFSVALYISSASCMGSVVWS
jgi:hypothetical protein